MKLGCLIAATGAAGTGGAPSFAHAPDSTDEDVDSSVFGSRSAGPALSGFAMVVEREQFVFSGSASGDVVNPRLDSESVEAICSGSSGLSFFSLFICCDLRPVYFG
jgi:hypothetical protein